MFSIYKKEIASYFNSLIGYLAIGLFLLMTGLLSWVFPETSILDAGYASLDGFFSIAPYLLMFLAPAILMRSIAGEKSDGTYDLLISRPISLQSIVLGKYLGGLTIIVLAIIPSIVYGISIYLLAFPKGNIDIGATIGSYIGLIFLAGAFSAIAIFCSSLTKNPIVAFLLSVFSSFIFYYGFNAISQIDTLVFTEEFIRYIGIQDHYETVSRGVLSISDLCYFFSLIGFFIILTIGHLGRKFRPRKKTFTVYASTILIIFIANQSFLTSLFDRIDFTEEKRFTLSDTSKDIVKKLNKDIYITIFLDGDLPSGFKRLKQATIDMAHDLKSYSNGKIKINVINPSQGSQEEQQELANALVNRGLYPTNLSVKTSSGFIQKLIFPSAIINHGEKEINVNLLQNRSGQSPEEVLNNSIQNLEYSFTSAITKIVSENVPFIGFTEGHGEPNDLELYDAMTSLSVSNRVGRLNLDSISLKDLQQIKIIFITKPQTKFSESDKYKIDYFVRNGGSVVWSIDQINASMDLLRQQGSLPLIGKELNLDDQLFLYGAKFNYNMVADLNCAQIPLSVGNIAGKSQIELAPWYFFPIIMPTSQNPLIKNLDGIRTEFIGTIDTIATKGIRKEVLLSTSPFTRVLNTPSAISLQMVEEQPDPKKFKTKPEPVAISLVGRFPYLYENRPIPSGIIQGVDASAISKVAKMIMIADGDWLINQVNNKDESSFPLGWDRYTEQQYANKVFLENIVDYLMNDEQLISLRNREVKLRLLDQATVKEEKLKWQIINVALPIVILIIAGCIQQFIRKRKYTKKAEV